MSHDINSHLWIVYGRAKGMLQLQGALDLALFGTCVFNNVCVFKNAQFIMLMLTSYLCFLLKQPEGALYSR